MSDSRLPDDVVRQISAAIIQKRKIEAIKIYRDATGASLKDSKEYIESLIQKVAPIQALGAKQSNRTGSGVNPEVRSQISEALGAGAKIEAIKIYREATGAGLKEAKDFVEDFDSESASSIGRQTHSTHPATKSSGCGSNLLMFAVFVIGVLVFI